MPCHKEFSQNWKIYFFKAVAEDVVSRANNLEQVSSFLFWLHRSFFQWLFAFLTSLFHFFCLGVFYHQDSNLASCSGGFLWHFCGRLRSGLQLWRCRRNLETEIPECGCGYSDLGNEIYKSLHRDQGLLSRCAVWPTAETSSLSTLPWTLTHASSAGT